MKFGYTILYVEDVATTLKFYEDAFDIKTKMLTETGDYGELDTGDTVLAFAALTMIAATGKTPVRGDATKPSFEIALVTEDVPASLDRAMKAGAKLVQEPVEEPWGQTVSYVSDNNGFLVEICSPVI